MKEYKFTEAEFNTIKQALADGLEAVTEYKFEHVLLYVDKETSEPVKKPTEKQIKEGKVVLITDPSSTMQNLKTSFDARRLTEEMLEAGRIIGAKIN